MPRGYMEGPASEEREAALERGDHLDRAPRSERRAVYGSTEDEPEQHFIGWLEDIDPDELFASGRAWGLTVRVTAAEERPRPRPFCAPTRRARLRRSAAAHPRTPPARGRAAPRPGRRSRRRPRGAHASPPGHATAAGATAAG